MLQELRQARAKAVDDLHGLIAAGGAEYETKKAEVVALDGQIARALEHQEMMAKAAVPVAGQESAAAAVVPAQAKGPDYPVGRMLKALYHSGGNAMLAAQWAGKNYGESDTVFRSLSTSAFASGSATVPEDFSAMVIELLRPATVVRASNPIVVPMPRGTMRMPKQTGAATGGYGAEGSDAAASQLSTGNIVASFKKLTVLTPVSNDWLRYTSPATDQLAQNDIVLSLARTEDLAFLRGDGTMDWPKGMRSFAPTTNLIASNATPTLTTVDSELTQAIDALAEANVPMLNPCWFFRPKIKQFLLSLKNANGFYVFKDEMVQQKTLKGIPFRDTTTIPANLGGGGNQTEVTLADMSQAIIFDAMQLSLSISQEASYKDAGGNTVSSFTRDETLIRAIAEHDFHMRHDEAVAVITGVIWA